MRQCENSVAIDVIVVSEVARSHVHPHVHAPDQGLDRIHLPHLPCGGKKFVECPRHGLVESDTQKDKDFEAKASPVYLDTLAEDDAGLLHALDPPPAGAIRAAGLPGQFGHRHTGLFLHQAQETPVHVVQVVHESIDIPPKTELLFAHGWKLRKCRNLPYRLHPILHPSFTPTEGTMRVYYDRDCDINLIKDKKVAIVGYGSQGHAHALNLRDSGAKNVAVALREGSPSAKKAEGEGLKVMAIAEAAKWADVIMMTMPDELQAETYKRVYPRQPARRRRDGVRPRPEHPFRADRAEARRRRDHDRAEGTGPHRARRIRQGRRRAVPGGGRTTMPAATRWRSAKSYCSAIGGGRSGIIETDFKEECETDLFGEQAVLCGGLVELIRMGFETLVEAGYEPEMAYFECLHEVKLIVDLIYEGGIANMSYSISNTAEYGEYVSGPRIMPYDETKARMKAVLEDIQSGRFVATGCPRTRPGSRSSRRRAARNDDHQIEAVGEKLRGMMPWISAGKMVDKSRN